MNVSVLIANWNTCEELRLCLQSIKDTAGGINYEIILVDNASSDNSISMVSAEFPDVHLIQSRDNLGFGRANNLALGYATGDYVLLLNPDVVLHPGSIQGLSDHLHNHNKSGAVGPRIFNPDGSLQVSISPRPTLARETWRLFHGDQLYPVSRYPSAIFGKEKAVPVDVLLGACILLRREVLETTGLFDEQFFMYSEEVDLCLRIQKAGWQIDWLPSVGVTHYGGRSTSQVADVMFLELYRNKIKYFRKHEGVWHSRIYKGILYSAALARWLPGNILGKLPPGRKAGWKDISRRYKCLMDALPQL